MLIHSSILNLIIIFLVIVLFLFFKRTLYESIFAGILTIMVLYYINPIKSLELTCNVIKDWTSMSILVVLYLITFLQRMLEKREQIKKAQLDLNGIFHNRRVNASVAPLFIGLLPSAAAMILCGDIVKDSTEGYLNNKEQAFITSWFRHIPESTLPTYSGVLLMSYLSGVPISKFIVGMIVPIIVLAILGYIPYIYKLPKDPGTEISKNKLKDCINLFKHLWSLLSIILLILIFNLSVELSILIVIIISLFIYKFKLEEIKPMFKSALEPKMLISTFLVLLLKEFISYTGMLETLPETFSTLPIPIYLVFALLFFIGGIISGTNGIIALGTPIAFSSITNAGMPLMVLLMCMCHAASQVSPTHVCLVVATEYFNISLGELIKKTIPAVIIFCILMIFYYQFLLYLLGV